MKITRLLLSGMLFILAIACDGDKILKESLLDFYSADNSYLSK